MIAMVEDSLAFLDAMGSHGCVTPQLHADPCTDQKKVTISTTIRTMARMRNNAPAI